MQAFRKDLGKKKGKSAFLEWPAHWLLLVLPLMFPPTVPLHWDREKKYLTERS